MVEYRGAGPWGAGKGSNLTPAEVDENFYELSESIASLAAGLTPPVGIDSITYANGQVTFVMTDATEYGPYDLPNTSFRWRDRYTSGTAYVPMDAFFHPSFGGYIVLRAHTAAPAFDPDLLDGGLAVYRKMFSLIPGGNIPSQNISVSAHTAELNDASKYSRMTNASPSTVTIPHSDEVDFPLWTELVYSARGNNLLTIEAGTDVTVNEPPDGNSTLLVGDVAFLKKIDTDEWDLWFTRGTVIDATDTTGTSGTGTGGSEATDTGTGTGVTSESEGSFPGNIYTLAFGTTPFSFIGYWDDDGAATDTDAPIGAAINPISGKTVYQLTDEEDQSASRLRLAGLISSGIDIEVEFTGVNTPSAGAGPHLFIHSSQAGGNTIYTLDGGGFLGLADDTWYTITLTEV
jgi:hypothetical protein